MCLELPSDVVRCHVCTGDGEKKTYAYRYSSLNVLSGRLIFSDADYLGPPPCASYHVVMNSGIVLFV